MARIRSVKPELRTDLTVAGWPMPTRYGWVLLWGYLDDYGRGVDDSRLLAADLFPLDDDMTARKVEAMVATWSEAGLVCRYEVDGRRYLHAVNWHHQRINRPTDSRIPACPSHGVVSDRGSDEDSDPVTDRDGDEVTGLSLRARKEQVLGAGSREQGAGKTLVRAEPRPDVDALCQHLADRIEGNGSLRPTVTARWREAARLMLDRDGRTEQHVHAAIDWCQSDEFWRSNVLSMPKLREKYDQLRLKAASNGRPPTTDQRVAAGADLARQLEEAGR